MLGGGALSLGVPVRHHAGHDDDEVRLLEALGVDLEEVGACEGLECLS